MTTQFPQIQLGAAEFDRLPNSALVDVQVVAQVLGTSTATAWRWTRLGRLPAPVKLSPGTTRWRVGDLRRRMAEMAEVAAA